METCPKLCGVCKGDLNVLLQYNVSFALNIRFPEMNHDKKLNHIFLGCESDSECKKIGFYACVEGSCVGKYPNITQLRIIDLKSISEYHYHI